MPLTVTDLVLSPASVWYAPEDEPFPADTVPAGAPLGGNWAQVGFTTAPVKAGYEFEDAAPEVEQSIADVARFKTQEALNLETVMGELNLDLVPLAWGGSTVTTSPGAGQPGKQEYTLGGSNQLTVRRWCFEISYVSAAGNTHPIRLFVPRATAVAGGELEFSKTAYVGTPLKLRALADMTLPIGERLLKWQKITAPASS